MSNAGSRRMIPGRANLIVLFVTCILMLGFAEIVANRLMPEKVRPAVPEGWAIIPESRWVTYDADLGWVPERNKVSFLEKNGNRVPLTTNSLGLRGTREYAVVKPSGTKRIYAAGDSFTFGFGVPDDSSFPAQMEKLNPGLEVMNLGVPGYGVDQIYLSLKKFGFDYNPEIVTLALFPEDFWRATRAFNDAGNGKPYFVLRPDGHLNLMHHPVPRDKNFDTVQFPEILSLPPLERILYKSALYRLARKAMIRIVKSLGLEDPDTGTEWLLGRAILREAIREIRAHGARPVIVIVPPERWITGTVEPVLDSLYRFGEREKVQVVDLTPVFRGAALEQGIANYYLPQDGHWTAEGNRLAADSILKALNLEKETD